jgi:AcrR family transcriptional regulator
MSTVMTTTALRTGRLSAAQRRQQLLEAAGELVAERGFHAVSIEAVAARAGITRPIVYHHFGDLQGLLTAFVERQAERAVAQLARALPADLASGDPRELLLDAFRAYLEVVGADPETWRNVLMPPEGAPEVLRDHIAAGRAAVVAQLAVRVRPGFGPGRESPDPELTARTLSGLAEEAARLMLDAPERFPATRILEHTRWLLGLISPPAP